MGKIMEKQVLDILKDREEKRIKIDQLIKYYDLVVVKANIVGIDKNVFESYFLINYFKKIIEDRIQGYINSTTYSSNDGPYIIFSYPKGLIRNLKELTIAIEEKDPLGRLIDLDVHLDNHGSIKRPKLRKCLLCDDDAFVCNRKKIHTDKEIFKKMDEMILFRLDELLKKTIDEAMEIELNLPYKFGCVCINDNGSHHDMNALIMRNAKKAIIPYLVKMFNIGFTDSSLNEIFKKIRLLGIEAEQAMYQETKGVNCYKGLIFILGLIVASIGFTIKNNNHTIDKEYYIEEIFKNVKEMAKPLRDELNDDYISHNLTNGLKAFKSYNLKGARHQAIDGLTIVKNWSKELNEINEENLERCLIGIIDVIDDTVMFKRCGSIEKYQNVKEMIKNIDSKEKLINVNNYCIKENISVGGACDILITVIFLKKYLNYI